MNGFAPNDPSIPPRLRKRINSWIDRPPKTQFQQYGPLNAYFGIKSPPPEFLVKPQALLRTIRVLPGDMSKEDAISVLSGKNIEQEKQTIIKERLGPRVSLDSQYAIEDKTYPDFVITMYEGADVPELEDFDEINEADRIRMVVEVGSLGRELKKPSYMDRDRVLVQLADYLERMGKRGYRWKRKAVGIAIIGTEFSCLEPSPSGQFLLAESVKWESIYSDSFTHVIEEMSNPENKHTLPICISVSAFYRSGSVLDFHQTLSLNSTDQSFV